ncbi:APA family fibronectin-binding glycoprotein [Alloactinosynnema sp. L-07]|uniref:APA family fibronectin-binding glycoprotein n=1 Tax=Alloactinosynnema sp. L-07 TaxID=1653480 RepID=UPI0012F8F5E0|nr:APA family fibronectin-binding glycoprotein [Alloactinosynnema sp. L-07]
MITIVLLNRNGGTPEPVSAPPSTRPSQTASQTPTSTRTSAPEPGRIDNPRARLGYQVPDGWKTSDRTVEVLGVEFGGTAAYGAYQCGNNTYTRSFAVSAAARSKSEQRLNPEPTAATFAKAFGERFYPGGQVGAPRSSATEVDGDPAVVVTVKVTPKVADAACEASDAEVTVLAVPLSDKEISLLVVTSDLAGGPATPKPLTADAAQEIVESAARI